VNEKGFVNVLLDDVGSLCSLCFVLSNDVDNVLECFGYLDALPAVRVLSRLDDPIHAQVLVVFLKALEL
jgi:hypothetical protein